MTAIIMQRSDDPTTCMCCGRHAASIGVAKPRATMTTWTCDNPDCLKATKDLIMTDAKNLDEYEKRAIEAVAREYMETMLEECMQAMFASGGTDLNAITADQISLALDNIDVNGTARLLVKKMIISFGDHIRADVTNNAPPF